MVIKKTKVMDKWKLKKWYTVLAPSVFDNKPFCEIVATEESSLLNRIIKTSLNNFVSSGSQSAMFSTLCFRIIEVKGTQAFTRLIGHEIAPSFLRTFARRGKDLIHMVVDCKTKDGQDVRLKVIAVTEGKISENTGSSLRAAVIDEVKKATEPLNYDELMQEVIYGKLVSRLYNRLKQISSMKRVEIRKTELKERFT